MAKITLNVPQRIRLMDCLPQTGRLEDILIKNELVEKKIMFNKDEANKANITINGQNWSWTENISRTISFTEKEYLYLKKYIIAKIIELDEAESVDSIILSVCSAFKIEMAEIEKSIKSIEEPKEA